MHATVLKPHSSDKIQSSGRVSGTGTVFWPPPGEQKKVTLLQGLLRSLAVLNNGYAPVLVILIPIVM